MIYLKDLLNFKFLFSFQNIGDQKSSTFCKDDDIECVPRNIPDYSSSMPFWNLNDDCLIEIFSKLNASDLVVMSEICKRFQTIVFAAMPLCAIDIAIDHSSMDLSNRFLMTFGKVITNLTVQQSADCTKACQCRRTHELFNQVIKSCGPRLTALSFVNIDLPVNMRLAQQPAFVHLKSFKTIRSSLPDQFYEFLTVECKGLIRLILDNEKFKYRFPHVQLVTIYTLGRSFPDLYNLVENHNRLKELQLSLVLLPISKSIFPNLDIFKHINKIKFELEQSFSTADSFIQFSTWTHITSLRISGMHIGVPSFVYKMIAINSLQTLELHDILVNKHLIKGIAKFRNLRRLHLVQTAGIGKKRIDWKDLECLQNLSELKFGGHIDINHGDLIDLAKSLPMLELLDLTLLKLENKAKTCEDIAEIGRNRNRPIVVLKNARVPGYGHHRWNLEIETDATDLTL